MNSATKFVAVSVVASGCALAFNSSPSNAATLFSQTVANNIAIASDIDVPSYRADNFTLSSNSTITDVLWSGIYFNNNTPQANDAFTVRFYNDNSGNIGSLVQTFSVGNAVGRTDTGVDYFSTFDIYSYNASLGGGLNLNAGAYWVAIYNDTTADLNDNWAWAGQGNVVGGDGSVGSSNLSSWATSGIDYSFELQGSVVPLPAAFPLLAGGLGLLGFIGWRRKRMMAA